MSIRYAFYFILFSQNFNSAQLIGITTPMEEGCDYSMMMDLKHENGKRRSPPLIPEFSNENPPFPQPLFLLFNLNLVSLISLFGGDANISVLLSFMNALYYRFVCREEKVKLPAYRVLNFLGLRSRV